MSTMKMSKPGMDMCIYYECGTKGPDLVAYQDSVGVWTYGVGAIVRPDGHRVQQGDRITLQEAEDLFQEQLESEAAHYVKAWYKNPLSQNQFDALVDFTYNRGAGRLRALLATPGKIEDNLISFDWAGSTGNHLLGLMRRRRSERAMFLGQDWNAFKNWRPQ